MQKPGVLHHADCFQINVRQCEEVKAIEFQFTSMAAARLFKPKALNLCQILQHPTSSKSKFIGSVIRTKFQERKPDIQRGIHLSA